MKLKITLLVTTLLFTASSLYAQNAVLVKDITSGTASTFSGGDDKIVGHLGDKLLFVVVDNNYISHLYVSEGTSASTVELATTPSQSVHFQDFVKVDNETMAFVEYNQNTLTYKLYTTDGITLTLLDAHDEDTEISNLKFQNGQLFYNTPSQIRTIDLGNTTDESVFEIFLSSFVDFYFDGPGTLYYGIKPEENDQDDTLYVYDIIDGKTSLGAIGESIAWGLNFQKVNGKILLFNRAVNGLAYFYATDGTAVGTELLKTFTWQGSDICNVQLVEDNQLYFDAALDPNDPAAGPVELFVSDGTVSGTYSVNNISESFKDPKTLVAYNGNVYFQATSVDGFYPYLYVTDGSLASAFGLGVRTYFNAEGLAVSGDGALVATSDEQTSGVGVVVTNGIQSVPEDAEMAFFDLSHEQTSGLSYEGQLYATDTKLYFIGSQDEVGRELYLLTPTDPVWLTSTQESQDNTNHLSLYPNPATDQVKIEYTGSDKLLSVQLRDIDGRLIREFHDATILDISDVKQGLYCLDIRLEHSQRMVKLVKK